MAKADKKVRVNVPFRVLPETLTQLNELAERDDRTPANMLEKIIKDLHQKTKSDKS